MSNTGVMPPQTTALPQQSSGLQAWLCYYYITMKKKKKKKGKMRVIIGSQQACSNGSQQAKCSSWNTALILPVATYEEVCLILEISSWKPANEAAGECSGLYREAEREIEDTF